MNNSPTPNYEWCPMPLQPIASYVAVDNPANFVQRVMAAAGPMTPTINLPVSLFELKDIPRMLKHAGDLLHKIDPYAPGYHRMDPGKEAASANLAWNFGWGPLIQDMGKMLDLADTIRKRMENVKKARTNPRGLGRRVSLENASASRNDGLWLDTTYGTFIPGWASSTTTVRTWGTTRWIARDAEQFGKSPTFMEEARNAMGLTPGHMPLNAWKAFPWSWAIDWFGGVSDMINVWHNQVYYIPQAVCIMRTTSVISTYAEQIFSPTRKLEGGVADYVVKERWVFNPTYFPTLRIPFMDPFKLSILGSLAILRSGIAK